MAGYSEQADTHEPLDTLGILAADRAYRDNGTYSHGARLRFAVRAYLLATQDLDEADKYPNISAVARHAVKIEDPR